MEQVKWDRLEKAYSDEGNSSTTRVRGETKGEYSDYRYFRHRAQGDCGMSPAKEGHVGA